MKWKNLLCEQRSRQSTSKAGNADLRNEFQKDYHRIIGSASFRRLQDKTQVFPLDRSDFVRTRLTHSLEVSSFAKSLGQMIFRYIRENGMDSEITEGTAEKICSVLECAGLIHDIGNPPFGHFGEDYIRSWFRSNLPAILYKGTPVSQVLTDRMCADFYNFEGNAQALRLLTKLHFLIDENGMNLNYTLLNTIIKYPVPSDKIDKNSGDIKTKKMGCFYAEREIFEKITQSTGAGDNRHPLVFILEAADDIAYKTADIEDAVKKGFITYSQLVKELNDPKYTEKCADENEKAEYLSYTGKLCELYENAIKNNISDPEGNAVQNWIIKVQGFLLKCARYGFTKNYTAIMNGEFKHDILSKSYGNALAYALGDIAYRYVFTSKPIYKTEIAAAGIFEFLLNRLVRGAVNCESGSPSPLDTRLMSLISENYKKAYELHSSGKDDCERLYLRLMLVTDYICGMTDGYAARLYKELNGAL